MRAAKLSVLPAFIVVGIIAWIAANPAAETVGQEPTASTTVEARAGTPLDSTTLTDVAGATPVTEVTPAPVAGGLPAGLSGRLTYRSSGELITVQFPEAGVVSREPATPGDAGQASADGEWRMVMACGDASCALTFVGTDGRTSQIKALTMNYGSWSPTAHQYAFVGSTGPSRAAMDLMLVDDPASGVATTLVGGARSFAWTGEGALIASRGAAILRVRTDGVIEPIATAEADVPYLYAAPDRRTFAFTQTDGAGWRLHTVDAETGETRDLGNMGSDPAGTALPVELPPGEQKGPMYIAWSPDGRYLAFGGGFAPPYTMTTVDLTTGSVARTEFPFGYPGEMKWSPDGQWLAVSSYDVERTRHESYVVDPATGVARHLTSGCVIQWSYDGKFLAVHSSEADPGIAIVDIETGAQGKLTRERADAPLRWER